MVVAYSKNMRNAMIRDTVKAAQIAAMKAGDKDRTAATRSILAKVKVKVIEPVSCIHLTLLTTYSLYL